MNDLRSLRTSGVEFPATRRAWQQRPSAIRVIVRPALTASSRQRCSCRSNARARSSASFRISTSVVLRPKSPPACLLVLRVGAPRRPPRPRRRRAPPPPSSATMISGGSLTQGEIYSVKGSRLVPLPFPGSPNRW